MSYLEYNGNRFNIPQPNYRYSTSVIMPFHYVQRANGSQGIWDDGPEFDYRVCTFEIDCDRDRALNLIKFINKVGRKNSFTLYSDGGFYPFGPDYPIGTYEVSLVDYTDRGEQQSPWLYHTFEVEIIMESGEAQLTDFSTTCDDEGNVGIGTVTGLPFPPKFFTPKHDRAFYTTITRGGSIYRINRGFVNSLGSNPGADYSETSFELNTYSRLKMGEVVYYLTNVARNGVFILNTPSNSYPFGIEYGDSAGFPVTLAINELKIRNNGIKEWLMPLRLRRS